MLPEIISSNDGEMVKARMAFEEAARTMQLDSDYHLYLVDYMHCLTFKFLLMKS